MLNTDFFGRSELLEQIKNAYVIPNYNKGFISLSFRIEPDTVIFPYNVRNPVEMRAFQKNRVPIVFIIHVIDGYLAELEIFNADSSEMYDDFYVDDIELVINSKLVKK